MEDPPADRAEDPLPEEQRQADREEEGGRDPRGDGNAAEDGDLLDLVEDLADLGLRQVYMRADEPLARCLRRADLFAEARRLFGRRVGAGFGCGECRGIQPGIGSGRGLGVGAGCGRLRLVQWGGLPCVVLGPADDTSDGQSGRPNAPSPSLSAASKNP
jgi:hypothetical protein